MVSMTATSTVTASLANGLGADSMLGVASLDTPQVQQTKLEIRALVAEIAELANRRIEPPEFYSGMLPRICLSMGATGAAVWRVDTRAMVSLAAQHALPSELVCRDGAPSETHSRIINCILSEGQPVLVPAGSVAIEAGRPENPFNAALIVIPVRIDQHIDFLLEVVQPAGGGPVAQRGYLRFVAQMADLMSDFLRRAKLRDMLSEQDYVARFQQHLSTVASVSLTAARVQAVADSLASLLEADKVIILNGDRRLRVRAINHLDAFDPRSEVILSAERVARIGHQYLERLGDLNPTPNQETMIAGAEQNPHADQARLVVLHPDLHTTHPEIVQLAELMNVDRLYALRLNSFPCVMALVGTKSLALEPKFLDRAERLACAFGTLISPRDSWLARTVQVTLDRLWQGGKPRQSNSRSRARWFAVQRWMSRLAIVGLMVVLALFPVPQQVSVPAILEPVEKQLYYAPSASVVDKVNVNEGDSVQAGDSLIELVDQQLLMQVERLTGELEENHSRIGAIGDTLSRDTQMRPVERDLLESQRQQLTLEVASLQDQLALLSAHKDRLNIRARRSGQVASWDLRNRFTARPMAAGQLLVTTFEPDGLWQLQLSIPEIRCGMVAQAIESNATGARIQYSLTGHPGLVLEGRLATMNTQAFKDSAGQTVILAKAKVESRTLPIKKDGAVARATIDCGQVPAIWLVLRDAVEALRARIEMVW